MKNIKMNKRGNDVKCIKKLISLGNLKKFERNKSQQIDINESLVLTKPNKWSYPPSPPPCSK